MSNSALHRRGTGIIHFWISFHQGFELYLYDQYLSHEKIIFSDDPGYMPGSSRAFPG